MFHKNYERDENEFDFCNFRLREHPFSALGANAQENAVVIEETAVTTTDVVECKTHYSSSWRDNWFIQIGAGASFLLSTTTIT